jgi:integrase/recombinase XerD
MNSSELEHFQSQYEEILQAMMLNSLRTITIESYCSSMRYVAQFFDCSPDDLSPTELKDFISAMLERYSWSYWQVLF